MSRLATPLLVVTLAASLVGSGLVYSIRSAVVEASKPPERLPLEIHPVSSTVYTTIVKGEIPDTGPPLIKVSVTVTTPCEEEQTGCLGAHRAAVEEAAQGLINVTYEYP